MGIETFQFVCDVPARQLLKSIRSHKSTGIVNDVKLKVLHESSLFFLHHGLYPRSSYIQQLCVC